MFCGKCGKELNAGATFCPYCGAPMPAEVSPAPQAQPPVQPQFNPYAQGFYAPQGASQKEVDDTNTFGIVSLIGSFFLPLLGMICGFIGLSKIGKLKDRANTEQQQKLAKSKKLCLAGVIISIALVVISTLIGILWGVYISRRVVRDFQNNNPFDYGYFDSHDYGDYDDIEDFFDQYDIEFD